jgi:hypothetical protein
VVVADTEIVRVAGVANAPDDTLPTLGTKSQYGRRIAPRPPTIPDCAGTVVCIADTARTRISVDCCIPDQRVTNWLIFAVAGDSMQIFSSPGSESYAMLTHATPPGYWREGVWGVDGAWIRFHFPGAGTYVFEESISADDSTAYELRVIPVVATGATRITGGKARIALEAGKKDRIAIVPAALARTATPAAMANWAVSPGRYAAMLVRDTTYVACRLPCARPTSFTMKAGQRITLTFTRDSAVVRAGI